MKNKQPPFQITNKIIDDVAEISELTGRLSAHDHQQEYYDAINANNDAGESSVFIEFMLSTIKALLIGTIHTNDAMSSGKMDKKALRWQKIEQFLQTYEYIMNADVRGVDSNGKSDTSKSTRKQQDCKAM